MTLAKPETMGDKIDDAFITTHVKMTLVLKTSTSALHTSITTKDGVLMGGAYSHHSRQTHSLNQL